MRKSRMDVRLALIALLAAVGMLISNPAMASSKPAPGVSQSPASTQPAKTGSLKAAALQRCFSHAWMDAASTPGTTAAGGAGRCVGEGVFNYMIVVTTIKRNGDIVWSRHIRYVLPQKGVRYQAPMYEGRRRWGRWTATVEVYGCFTRNRQCYVSSSITTDSDTTW